MPQLISDEHQAINIHGGRSAVKMVPQVCGVHHVTVYRLVCHHQTTGSVADWPWSGTSRVTTPRLDMAMQWAHAQDCFLPAFVSAWNCIGTCEAPVSSQTRRWRLAEDNLRCRRLYRGQLLTDSTGKLIWLFIFLGHWSWQDVTFFWWILILYQPRRLQNVSLQKKDERFSRDRYRGVPVVVCCRSHSELSSLPSKYVEEILAQRCCRVHLPAR